MLIIKKAENGYLIEVPVGLDEESELGKQLFVVSLRDVFEEDDQGEAEAWKEVLQLITEFMGPEYKKYGHYNTRVIIAPGHKADIVHQPGKCWNCGEEQYLETKDTEETEKLEPINNEVKN